MVVLNFSRYPVAVQAKDVNTANECALAKNEGALKLKGGTIAMAEAEKTDVQEVLLDDLVDFHNHPFFVPGEDDSSIKTLAESIRENGVLTPAIVRKLEDGRYELISGHRRRLACKVAGLATMPVIVKEYASEDDAITAVINANLQRKEMLPSEKARVYGLRYEVLKHQGKATVEKNGEEISGNSLKLIGQTTGDSEKTVQRYMTLLRLTGELLDMVDSGKLSVMCGVELSSLPEDAQKKVLAVLKDTKRSLKVSEAKELKRRSSVGVLTDEALKEVLSSSGSPLSKGITISTEELEKYFGADFKAETVRERILKLLEQYGAMEGRPLEMMTENEDGTPEAAEEQK
jgi:ParB family chromosome partitioning protein